VPGDRPLGSERLVVAGSYWGAAPAAADTPSCYPTGPSREAPFPLFALLCRTLLNFTYYLQK